MESIGQVLRRERERQKRSLSAIAKETCIGTMYLDAIERDKIATLPGYFFYKSYVKQYASTLGIDYSSLEAQVRRADPAPIHVAAAKPKGGFARYTVLFVSGLFVRILAGRTF